MALRLVRVGGDGMTVGLGEIIAGGLALGLSLRFLVVGMGRVFRPAWDLVRSL